MIQVPIEETILFCRALRDRGLTVTPSESLDAVRSLNCIDVGDREETFLSLRAVLASRVEDFPVFEELFDDFWRRITQPRPENATRRRSQIDSSHISALSSLNQTASGLAFFLENWGTIANDRGESMRFQAASDAESNGEKDLSLFGAAELEEVRRVARKIAKKLALNPGRRWKPARHGPKLHLRRSFRQSMKTAGELVEMCFRERKQKKTKLIVICDVSGSMDRYSRLLVQFVYSLQNSFARVETFVFSTSLARITGHLKRGSYETALGRLAANVRGWSGGTLIGSSLARFNSDWIRLVDRRTVIIILSDGWDTGKPEDLAASLAKLKARSGRLIWLNPLLGRQDYQPLTRGMQAALPHIDVFAPAHNLASLRTLECHLVL